MEMVQEDVGLAARLAGRIGGLRKSRGLTLEDLAGRSGVSRSMLSLIERSEASPTAAVLDRIAAGLSVSLSTLFAAEPQEAEASPLARRREQVEWRDPESGYVRRNLSPPGFVSPIQMAEITFPAGARVAFDTADREVRLHQQIFVLEGQMELSLGRKRHRLSAGDCLAMHVEGPVGFFNPGPRRARYIVVNVSDRDRNRR